MGRAPVACGDPSTASPWWPESSSTLLQPTSIQKAMKDGLKPPKKWNKLRLPRVSRGRKRVQQRQNAGEFVPLARQGKAFGETHQMEPARSNAFPDLRDDLWKCQLAPRKAGDNSRVSQGISGQVFIHSPKGLRQFQEGKSNRMVQELPCRFLGRRELVDCNLSMLWSDGEGIELKRLVWPWSCPNVLLVQRGALSVHVPASCSTTLKRGLYLSGGQPPHL